jgi:hypothetical protein
VETEATTTKSKQATKKNKAKTETADNSDQDTDTEDSDAESANTSEIIKRLRSNFKAKAVRTESSPDSSPSTKARASWSEKDRKRDAKARKVRSPQELAYDLTLYLPFYIQAVRTDSSPDSSPDSLPSTNARASRSEKDRKRDAKARKVRTPQELAYDSTLYLPFYIQAVRTDSSTNARASWSEKDRKIEMQRQER